MNQELIDAVERMRAAFAVHAQAATDTLADAMDHWTMRQHSPVPDQDGQPVCVYPTHNGPVSWPCREHLTASDRVDERQARRNGVPQCEHKDRVDTRILVDPPWIVREQCLSCNEELVTDTRDSPTG